MNSSVDTVRPLVWSHQGLEVLDQRRLPDEVVYHAYQSVDQVAEAIASMQVRGAPAIGIAAAYGVVLAARDRFSKNPLSWRDGLETDLGVLAASRPTAVNLFWALDRMRAVIAALGASSPNPFDPLEKEAIAIHKADIEANLMMGHLGARYLQNASGILTHCNTGSLATGGYGTALGVIRSSVAEGAKAVYATETRPWSQGARLTIWELNQDKIPATLIADSAAALLMHSGRVQWVIVGADRIAANGDTANKIGTYALSVAARHHGVKMMVVAPMSTIDWKTASGQEIHIEERDSAELLSEKFRGKGSVISAWNPVFDVTPAGLIDVIVTEKGVVENPSMEAMRHLLG